MTQTATSAPGEDDEIMERLEDLDPDQLRRLADAMEERWGTKNPS